MIPILLFEVCVPLLLGFLLVRAIAPRAGMLLAGCLGVGAGIGAVSCCLFVALLTGLPPLLLEPVLLLGILAMWWRRTGSKPQVRVPMKPFSTLELALGAAFAALILYGIAGWVLQHRAAPMGDWDAWSDWNLRARFLTTDRWRDGFSSVMSWAHPDYPLLLPGFVARVWRFTGRWEPIVPAVAGFLFTFATVGVLAGSLALLKGRAQGFAAGIFLLVTPSFISEGVAQLADVPISFFILATLALLAMEDRFQPDASGFGVLAGLTAGMAAWTKNEGLLLILAVVLTRGVIALRTGGVGTLIRRGRYFGLGILPPALIIVIFKRLFAQPNDHVGIQSAGMLAAMVTDKNRHAEVSQAFLNHGFNFGGNKVGVFLVLAVWLACVGLDTKANREGIRTALGILAIVFSGYYVVYLISPHGIAWLVGTSLDRVLLQLWPPIIFTALLSARTPSFEALRAGEVHGHSR